MYIIRYLLRYIIKPQADARLSVMRYKGGSPPLMIYAALRASMIYQACGLDKKTDAFASDFLVRMTGLEPARVPTGT